MNKWEDKEYRYVCWDVGCKWPEYTQSFNDDDDLIELYKQRVIWLYENIDMCERHCRWVFNNGKLIFRFRHDRDRTRFVLRWS